MSVAKTFIVLATLVGVVISSGCSMIPSYERPAAPVAATFADAAAAPAAAARSPPNRATADIGWRQFIIEQRLQKLIELALANNRDLRIATLNVEQSRAQYRVTRSSSFPTVDGSGGYTKQRSLGITMEQWSANVGTTAYELDLFGRVHSLNTQALEQFFSTQEAQRSAQVSLVGELATQYYSLREAEEQLRLAHQTLDSVQESYDLNNATFNAGASNELDLRIAEGQVETAQLNVLNYEREMAQARDALVLLVGEPLPADLPESEAFGDGGMMADIPEGLPSELVQRRPDILQAEHILKAANANIGAARAAFFPSIALTASVGAASAQLSSLFSASSGAWTFSPQVTLPIFTAGQNRAELDVAKITTRIDVASYEKAIQTAFREVADALIGNSSYSRQITTEAALITAQQRRFDLANLRYRNGEDTYLNVLSAQQDLYSARQGLLQAQYNKLASQISLYQALGGGWK